MQVYGFSDYKEFLKARLAALDSPWGAITQMAKAAGCQRSYFSRVLSGQVHLTPDHAYGLTLFLDLSANETEYFLALLEKERAASASFRRHLEQKLHRLRKEQENLALRLQRPRVDTAEKELTYYSAWYWSALHILVSIPQYQTSRSIASKLEIPEPLVLSGLQTLERFGLVRTEKGRWTFASGDLHIPKESPFASLHHNNWRQRAVLRSQGNPEDGVHYTSVQSMTFKTYEQLKQNLLVFIEQAAKLAGPSKEEELVCLTLDVFRV